MEQNEIDIKIFDSLERIGESFKIMLTLQSKNNKLSNIQIQILIYLLNRSEEICTLTHLSKNFSITKSSLSDSVKALESKGYITKVKSKEDSRVQRIILTDTGKGLAIHLSDFSNSIMSITSKIPDENKQIILNSLLDIIHGLYVQGLISIERMCFNCIYFVPNESISENYCILLKKKLSKITKRDLKYYLHNL